MAFCAKCGSAVSNSAAFCSVCGAPTSSADSSATPAPRPAPAGSASAGISSNVAAALSYFFITGIIFLLIDQYKRDKFVRFHSFQAIAYGVVVTIFWILWNNVLLAAVFSLGFLWSIISLLSTLISLAIFIYWLFLMYKAYNNEMYQIPIIGDWAFKQSAK
jgi:uncharacterized membrane protein